MGYSVLKEKVVIVTGANHGIGQATAIAFAREGAKVLINYYRAAAEGYGDISEEQARNATVGGREYYYKMQTKSHEQTVEAIHNIGGTCHIVEADLAEATTTPLLFDQAYERWGPVDVVVNNAAYCKCDTFLPESELSGHGRFLDEFPIQTICPESHEKHFAVNSRAVALMMREYAKRYIERNASWGRIINISTDGAHGHPNAVSYGASKLAMESYTRAAARELGPYGINVNVVSPGAVQTGYLPPEHEEDIRRSYPTRKIGKPDYIADAVVFLASEKADWITGQVLHVGGGNWM